MAAGNRKRSGGGERIPPQAPDVERSVLASIMLDSTAANTAMEELDEEAFYVTAHRHIYGCMREMYNEGKPIDIITVADALKKKGLLEAVGAEPYLSELADSVATSANISHYAKILTDKATLRSLISTSGEITTEAFNEENEPDKVLDWAESKIFSISESRIRTSFQKIGKLLPKTFEEIEGYTRGGILGVPSGFNQLDEMTTGLQRGDLIILAARPSMGKTAFALSIALHAAVKAAKAAAIFSLEMSHAQLVQRMLCAEARIDMHALRSGTLPKRDLPKLSIAAGPLYDAPIYIDDTPGISVLEIRAKARRLKAQGALDLILIDYLQLMTSAGQVENRQQEISQISRSLKALGKELDVPVVALSQLSRAVEQRGGDKRPQLSDLRECVTADTRVVLADGRRVPVGELVGSTPRVIAVDSRRRLCVATAEKVWRVGVRPVFKVRLASGKTIRATAGHRLLGATGWREVSSLRVGDRLALARHAPEPKEPCSWPEHEVILLAHLIGDGSYPVHQPLRYTTASEDNSAVVASCAQQMGSTVRRVAGRGRWHQLVIADNGNRWRPAGVGAWLKGLGVFGQRSAQKRVPEELFCLGNDQIALFLRHLWATDGCISVRPDGAKGEARVYFSTCSEGLASDCSALLLRFGIVARTRTVCSPGSRPVFTVEVCGSRQQRKFLDTIGAFGPRREPAGRLAANLDGKVSNPNVDVLPREVFGLVRSAMKEAGVSQRKMAALRGTAYGGSSHFRFEPSRATIASYAHALNCVSLDEWANSDMFWDKIVGIEADGEEEVFDLTVPGPACWLADGIVSHNSGAIEQDADVVMFVFREEYYKPDDPDLQGVAELIIAKQRNGPTGTVKLAFVRKFARFENPALMAEEEF